MKAVIMAGGRGTRLRPLTCDLPKPLVPIVNYPVMEHIINLLAKEGIVDIAVTTFYLPRTIEEYFGTGEKWGVNLHYYREETPLGTAGSVHNASDFLDETFVVISGDAITDFSLKEAAEFHYNKEAEVTLVMTRAAVPLEYGVVMTDQSDRIVRFLEKPGWGQVFSDTINTGIYVLEPSIFSFYEKGKKYDFSKDLFPLLLQEGRPLYGYEAQGYWNDIGNIEEYHQTHTDFLRGQISLPLPDAKQLAPGILVEEGVEIHPGANLKPPLYIGRDSRIEDGVILEDSVIGRYNLIRSHATIQRSIMWHNNHLGRFSEIRGGILGSDTVIRAGALVCDKTALGSGVEIGRESQVRTGVRIWPERKIESDIVVDGSIVHPRKQIGQLFSRRGIKGELNIDITSEFISRLAGALAAVFSRDSRLTISSDSSPGPTSLKSVMSSSLQLSGIDIIDLKQAITPVVRYSINNLKADGGIHLHSSGESPEMIVIEFFDQRGINFSPDMRRTLAKKMSIGDFNRVAPNEIGETREVPEMSHNYLQDLLDELNIPLIRRNFFKLVADYRGEDLTTLLPLYMKKLNCQVLVDRNYKDEEPAHKLERFRSLLVDNEADLGIYISDSGERLELMTADGNILSEPQYQVLLARLLLKRGMKQLFLPVNSPEVIEDMAREEGAEVVYRPTDFQAAMSAYHHYLAKNEEHSPPYFNPQFDALFSLGLLLEEMAREDLALEDLMADLPDFYFNQAEISCPQGEKGRVMRRLAEEAEEDAGLIDGVKFYHDHGWALVIPDNEQQVFHIFAEGIDMESAESLTGFYLNKIENIIKQ